MGKPTELPGTAGEPSEYAPVFEPLVLPSAAIEAGAGVAAGDGLTAAVEHVTDWFGA